MKHFGFESLIQRLTNSNIPCRIHEHDPVRTMKDVIERLKFPEAALVKTLVVRLPDDKWVLAALQASRKLDFARLAGVCDTRRAEIRIPTPEEIESALGVEIGGISPIPLGEGTIAIFDEGIRDMETVYCGAGRCDRTLEISGGDLERIADARTAAISKHE